MTIEQIRERIEACINKEIQLLMDEGNSFETDISYSIEEDFEQGLDLISNAIYNSQIKKGE